MTSHQSTCNNPKKDKYVFLADQCCKKNKTFKSSLQGSVYDGVLRNPLNEIIGTFKRHNHKLFPVGYEYDEGS